MSQPESGRGPGFWTAVGGVAALLTALVAVLAYCHTIQPSNAKFRLVGEPTSTGSCTRNGCPVSATFHNDGDAGDGSARFRIVKNDDGTVLAECTAPISRAEAGGTGTASCNAQSGALGDYLTSGPPRYLPLHVDVQVL